MSENGCLEKLSIFCETHKEHCLHNCKDGAYVLIERLGDWLRKNFETLDKQQLDEELQNRMDAIFKKKEEYETWNDTLEFSNKKRKRPVDPEEQKEPAKKKQKQKENPFVLPFALRHTNLESVNQVVTKANGSQTIIGLIKNQWYQVELPIYQQINYFSVRCIPSEDEDEDEDDLNRHIGRSCKCDDVGLYRFRIKDLSGTFDKQLKYFELTFSGDNNKTFVISPVVVVSKMPVLKGRGFK